MRSPALAELPPPPPGKTGWPWTEESAAFPATQPNGAAWPKIGIVTPSYNQADFLEQSIRSVLLQGYPDLDYVVIDGGSTDQSVAVIRKYERWLSYWVSERDRGCSDASAKGLARTDAALLGVMNGDDFFAPGGLAKLLALRTEHPDYVFWGGTSPELDLAGQLFKVTPPFVHDQQAIGNWGVGMWCFGVGSLFDGAAYRTVGGFDPRFRIACDVDLWIRLGKIGQFVFTPDTVAFVHHNPGSVARRDGLENHLELVATNFLNGNHEIARLRMLQYLKKWLRTLKERPPLTPDAAEDILALAPPGVLAKALLLSSYWTMRRSLGRIFRRQPRVPSAIGNPNV